MRTVTLWIVFLILMRYLAIYGQAASLPCTRLSSEYEGRNL